MSYIDHHNLDENVYSFASLVEEQPSVSIIEIWQQMFEIPYPFPTSMGNQWTLDKISNLDR